MAKFGHAQFPCGFELKFIMHGVNMIIIHHSCIVYILF